MTDFYFKNGVLRCSALDLPGVAHGFSTRNGGVSALPHTQSLNLAYGRGDDDATVDENRRIFAGLAGFDPDGLVTADQVHSTRVVYAEGQTKNYAGCDGFVTDAFSTFIAVKTADCQPILFCDHAAGVVGACHAGWRGTVGGIAAETVRAMTALGADPERIIAALGPCIGKCCYEVKDDFVRAVAEIAPGMLRFIENGRADLTGMNRAVLLSAGVSEKNVHICGQCTCCHPELYYSHRRQKGVRGTMMSVIGKTETAD